MPVLLDAKGRIVIGLLVALLGLLIAINGPDTFVPAFVLIWVGSALVIMARSQIVRWGAACLIALMVTGVAASNAVDNRPCALSADAAVAPPGTPIGQLVNQRTSVLLVRSRDASRWQDVTYTVYGTWIAGTERGRPTGPFRVTKSSVEANGLDTVDFADLRHDNGDRWIQMTMRPDSLMIAARKEDRPCSSGDIEIGSE